MVIPFKNQQRTHMVIPEPTKKRDGNSIPKPTNMEPTKKGGWGNSRTNKEKRW